MVKPSPDYVVKLTEYKAILAIARIGVILFAFFAAFTGIVGHLIISELNDARKTEKELLVEVTASKEQLREMEQYFYGHRK